MSIIDLDKLVDPVIWYVVFLLSVTLHEAAHAWSAYKLGDNTAHNAGQVTLNPYPHIKREPIGTIIVPFLTYSLGGWMLGWASTPYSTGWAYEKPKHAALMSAAGPLGNFLLVLLSAGLIHLGIHFNYLHKPESVNFSSIVAASNGGYWNIAAKFLSILFSLNLILFVFNLIPIPPLDGSGIIPLFLPNFIGRKYLGLLNSRTLNLVGILIAWKIMDLIYMNIFTVFLNLLYPGSHFH